MAKPFKFRAEAVLKLREQREQLARRMLAEAQLRVQKIQGVIVDIRQQLRQQDDLVRQGILTGRVDVQYMSHYRRHVMALHRQIIDQAGQLQAAAGELQQVRGELLDAVRQRKTMSTLKDNLARRHRRQLQRVEDRQTDELSSTRFAHRQAGPGSAHP